ncbi:hypothetical protein [Falsiphaeobacter marinintestinus]|uniref:hypothetical protein n=1 Tax=Falsiphaeobacter marinintestinus TaxID=1492905 RepID=UPI0011B6ADE2|nr:hypothetical protein [Phaeobacter marinintestinus]
MMTHLFRNMALITAVFTMGALVLTAGQVHGQVPTPVAKWVKRGTYPLSGFQPNPVRGKQSYRGAEKEPARVLTFLPGMTIFFPATPQNARIGSDFLTGRTQTGLPVSVWRSDLSTSNFGSRETHEVVVHHAHNACTSKFCKPAEREEIGVGHSFRIVAETGGVIHLQNGDELAYFYREDRFEQLERQGMLTRVKDRTIPRWEVYEGYASRLSLPCGRKHVSGTQFDVSRKEYLSSADTWKLNSDQWDVKAVEVFVGGGVSEGSDKYIAEISKPVEDLTKPDSVPETDYKSAIDFTVFAYRDKDLKDGMFQFAVLISIVACEKGGPFGKFVPSYVREAHLSFDGSSYKLPDQMSEEGKRLLSNKLKRSMMYSVNGPLQHKRLFKLLSDKLDIEQSDIRANLVTMLISRLNATCGSKQRNDCAVSVKKHIYSE